MFLVTGKKSQKRCDTIEEARGEIERLLKAGELVSEIGFWEAVPFKIGVVEIGTELNFLDRRIEDLYGELSTGAITSLKSTEIETIRDLTEMTEGAFDRLKGYFLGKKKRQEIKDFLKQNGVWFSKP